MRYIHEDSSDFENGTVNVTESSFVATSSNAVYSEEGHSANETQQLLSNENTSRVTNIIAKNSKLQNLRHKFAQYSFFRSKANCLFIIAYIYFSNVTFFGLLNVFTSIKFILIGLFGLNNVVMTLLLCVFEQAKPNPAVIFRVKYVFCAKKCL